MIVNLCWGKALRVFGLLVGCTSWWDQGTGVDPTDPYNLTLTPARDPDQPSIRTTTIA